MSAPVVAPLPARMVGALPVAGTFRMASTLLIAVLATGCGPIVPDPRVPLPVPFPAVEGARAVVPTGVFVGLSFGDGFWGQERERAELTGSGFGLAIRDRVEFEGHSYSSNRTVDDENGTPHAGSDATTVRLKVRVHESPEGRWSFGVVGAHSSSGRLVPDVQHEQVDAWDLAFPVELQTLDPGASGGRLAIYGGPRFVRQAFESRLATAPEPTEDAGVAWGGLLGLKSRLGWLHLAAEGSLMRAPRLQVGEFGSEDGWMFIPALSARLAVPIGDGGGAP